MKKYFKILKVQFKNQIVSYSIFKGDTWLLLISDVFGLIFSVIFFKALFGNIRTIGSWTYEDTLLLVGVANFIDSLYRLIFEKNIRRISSLVRKGTLDYVFIKPIDIQIHLTTGRFNFHALSSLFLSIFLIIYAVKLVQLRVSVWYLLLFIVLLITGLALRYSFGLYASTLSFYITRVSAFHALQTELFKYAEYPIDVFRGLIERIIFGFLIPIIVIANVPVLLLIKNKLYIVFWGSGISIIHFLIARIFLFNALNKYQSAGG